MGKRTQRVVKIRPDKLVNQISEKVMTRGLDAHLVNQAQKKKDDAEAKRLRMQKARDALAKKRKLEAEGKRYYPPKVHAKRKLKKERAARRLEKERVLFGEVLGVDEVGPLDAEAVADSVPETDDGWMPEPAPENETEEERAARAQRNLNKMPVAQLKKVNKHVGLLRDALPAAAAAIGFDGLGKGGLVGYFMRVALKDEAAFMQALSRIIPIQVERTDPDQTTPSDAMFDPVEVIKRLEARGLPIPTSLRDQAVEYKRATGQKVETGDEDKDKFS